MRAVLICMMLLFVVSSCNKETEEESVVKMIVDSKTVFYEVVPSKEKTEHMIIIQDSKPTFYLPIGSIKDFEYEVGFRYKLLVKRKSIKNPPMDSDGISYILIEVLSKEKV